MRDLFIADAHLLAPQDANYRRLLEFLRAQRGRTRTLVLLGDIFEFWIGYRYCVFSAYVPLLEALRELREAGARIVYVEGNHDFHLGPYFAETLGCDILPDGGVIEGLFAAGEASGFGGGGVHGNNALEGTFLGGCIFSGLRAGRGMAGTAEPLG